MDPRGRWTTPISGTTTGDEPPVDAGTYTLSETGPANYTAGAWSCDGGTLTGNSLVLTPGVTAILHDQQQR